MNDANKKRHYPPTFRRAQILWDFLKELNAWYDAQAEAGRPAVIIVPANRKEKGNSKETERKF